jgi:glycosyltransferase involved in cell wall biosynthesis
MWALRTPSLPSMRVLALTESSVMPQRVLQQSREILRGRGIDVDLVTLEPAGALQQAGFASAALGVHPRRGAPLAALRLARRLRAAPPDLVHAHEVMPAIVAGLAVRLAGTRVPVVFQRHHGRGRLPLRAASLLASVLTDHTIAVSRSVAAAARDDDRRAAERITMTYNGCRPLRQLTDAERADCRRELDIPRDGLVVTMVGRFRPEKGHLILLSALESVVEELAGDVHLILVGDGPTRRAVERAVPRDPRLRVHFAGSQDDIAAAMSIADVVAVPSLSEPFGIVAIEAMSAGRATVASRVGGLAEIFVDGRTGRYVPGGDAAALAKALVELLADPGLRADIAAAAQADFPRFSVEAMVDGWITAYERALSGAWASWPSDAASLPTGARSAK